MSELANIQTVVLGPCTLICGDCMEVLPSLTGVDAVITDPPYGGSYDINYTRFTESLSPHRNHGAGIIGDDQPFDPAPWLGFNHVVLWGYHHFAHRTPLGTILFWGKKSYAQIGTFLSDGEIAWMKGGMGIYEYRQIWHGFDRPREKGPVLHPTQKPVGLIHWCMDKAKVPVGATVLDPYMGSGTTGIACIRTGRKFIGIEKDPAHFQTAVERIRRELQQELLPL